MHTRSLLALALCAITLPLAAQQSALPDAPAPSPAALPKPVPTGPTAVFDTTQGRMTCKLFTKEAPVTSQNFIDLAEGKKEWTDPVTHRKMVGKRFYDNTTFHRVIPGFMAQGGDPSGTGMGDAGYYFNNETSPNLTFDVPGRLAMANAGPNTNSSQFFITEVPVEQLNGNYSIFGQCDDASIDVVKAITGVPRDPQDKPLTPVILKKVTIVRAGQPMPPLPAAVSTLSKPAPRPIPSPAAR